MGLYVPWLVDAARMAVAGTGKQVIVSPGWQSRGHGPMRLVDVVVGHHTGTSDSAGGDYPSLPIVQNGRADLAGPLAQYGLGRSGNVYVIAAGLCYHAGVSAYGGYVDLNDEAIGIEAESAGGGGWTHDQLVMYPRLVGACLLYMRRPVANYASHRTIARPPGRKPDPTGIADDWMREQAAAFMRDPTPAASKEDDMTPEQLLDYSLEGGTVSTAMNKINVDLPQFQAETKAMLAEILAASQEDLDTETVLSRLDTSVRAATTVAITQTVLPAIQRIEAALSADNSNEAKAIVAELSARLHSAA